MHHLKREDPVLDAALAGSENAAAPAASWRGIVAYESRRDSIELRLAAPGGPDTSRVSIPRFAVEDAPLEALRAVPGRLSGRLRVGRHLAEIEVVPAGRRLIGTVAYQGRRLPVVLEPVAAP